MNLIIQEYSFTNTDSIGVRVVNTCGYWVSDFQEIEKKVDLKIAPCNNVKRKAKRELIKEGNQENDFFFS